MATYQPTDQIKVRFRLAPLVRRVKVKQVGFYANDASGNPVDWPVQTNVWIEPGVGYVYEQARTVPAGNYIAKAAGQKLDDAWRHSARVLSFTVQDSMYAAIADTYRTLLGRAPRAGEVEAYLASGKSLEEIQAEMRAYMTLARSIFHLKRVPGVLSYQLYWVDKWGDGHTTTTPVGRFDPYQVNGWYDEDKGIGWTESIPYDPIRGWLLNSLALGLPNGVKPRSAPSLPRLDWDGHETQLPLRDTWGDSAYG